MSKDGSLALSVRLSGGKIQHHIIQEDQGRWWIGWREDDVCLSHAH
jgi:hypothetical protein